MPRPRPCAVAEWANAVLNNGLGHYQALTAAHRAAVSLWELGFSNRAVIELIEAAARSGMSQTAASAYRRLAEITGCYVRTNRRPQGDLLPPGIGDLALYIYANGCAAIAAATYTCWPNHG